MTSATPEWLRRSLQAVALLPIALENFTGLSSALLPPPPLDLRARFSAAVLSVLVLCVVVVATWQPGRRFLRIRTAIALFVGTVGSLLCYFAVSEGYPQHSLLLDAIQVALWAGVHGCLSGMLGLAADIVCRSEASV